MPDRKPKPVRAWAVVGNSGRIIGHDGDRPLAVTGSKKVAVEICGNYRGRRVIRVTITPEPSDA